MNKHAILYHLHFLCPINWFANQPNVDRAHVELKSNDPKSIYFGNKLKRKYSKNFKRINKHT